MNDQPFGEGDPYADLRQAGKVCEHEKLQRQCDLCFALRDVELLRTRITELKQAYQDAKHEADEHLATITALKAENKRLVEERDCLHNAILWALGCNGDFPQRQDGQGAYWWRHELRRRCGVKIGPPRAANDARAGKEADK